KFVVVIAAGGALLGCGLGVMSGQAMAGIYMTVYKFPFLLFRVDPAAFVTAMSVSIASATAGGLFVLRKVFALSPAVAMRPPAPADYSASAKLVDALRSALDQPSRMIVRRIARQPMRTFAAVIGIGAGMGLSVGMLGVLGGFDRAVHLSYSVIDRSDASVALIEPLDQKTIFELKRKDGVIEVEPYRTVSVVLRNGVKTHRGGINGLIHEPRLYRALSSDMSPIYIREDGITLSQPLAEKLDIAPGELLTVEVREGRRPVLTMPVVNVSESLLGSPAYLELTALNEALEEPGRVSGAYLRLDRDKSTAVYEALKNMPAVAGVSIKEDARNSFQSMMDQGAGAMRYVMAVIAAIITFGIVYNTARIAFAERAHDLASLRVIGFTKAEAAYVLLGELGVITFFAIPLGLLIGIGLAGAIAAAFSTDLYTVSATVGPTAMGIATLAVVIASVIAGWMVKRDVDRLELVSALKSRD
ncbi:MAG: hypothetical protein MRY64_14300, partial [Hyphomonadaceae bacterium]|nr:hypothetical protein [Hyphomonadaceae bacterium]